MRTGDLENVGRTARHHTSLKCLVTSPLEITLKRCYSLGMGILTEVIKLDKNRLYVTVYPDDQEAYDTWWTTIVA